MLVAIGFLLLALVAMAGEDGSVVPKSRDLSDLSIEELMNVSVTSVSKKETRLQDSPAAIFVLTTEDIRRTGATSVPEALRIVPGQCLCEDHLAFLDPDFS